MRYLFLLFVVMVACKQATKDSILPQQIEAKKKLANDGLSQPTAPAYISNDTLYKLLDIAVGKDSMEYFYADGNFQFLTAGYLVSSTVKNAIIVYEEKKSFWVEVYALSSSFNHTLLIKDTLTVLMLPYLNFVFADYNFDSLKDIYIQESVSNGIAISRGDLFIQDSKGNLKKCTECRKLGNMQPDGNKHIVVSEERISCQYPSGSICKLINRWKNGHLITVKKDCPCKEENN